MIQKIYLGILPFLIASDIYIYRQFIRKFSKKTFTAIAWFLPSILILLIGFLYFFAETLNEYRGEFTILFLAFTLAKVIFFGFSLIDLPLCYFLKKKTYLFTALGVAAGISTIGIFAYGHIYGKEQFTVNNIEFSSPNLPNSFDEYRIVQISDIHIGNWRYNPDAIKTVVNMVNEQNPDAVMITGDLIHNRADELDGFEDILSGIAAKDGVFSVLGNHDYGLYRRWPNKDEKEANFKDLIRRQGAMGWQLLINENTFIHKGNDSIALIGVENDGQPPFPSYGDLPLAMKGTENTPFKILLSHDPSHWRREVLDTDIDLMLAGHTHGTQLAIGPLSPAAALYKEWGGMYSEGKQALYVNVGIAHVLFPFRFGAWPEITVITLKKEK
ncbi:metallophosphoesterase [Dysgonomonas sp. Marseille-P4361]|uniref:metallophosphoesterase n=1 Tax=Dysgonomonas sp. Marseille-P4361 TaxID=2161820 RepID=UPI000D55F016|nr:metallophosphoesterase [Dysgonomonas sp. Marseille-P4361]